MHGDEHVLITRGISALPSADQTAILDHVATSTTSPRITTRAASTTSARSSIARRRSSGRSTATISSSSTAPTTRQTPLGRGACSPSCSPRSTDLAGRHPGFQLGMAARASRPSLPEAAGGRKRPPAPAARPLRIALFVGMQKGAPSPRRRRASALSAPRRDDLRSQSGGVGFNAKRLMCASHVASSSYPYCDPPRSRLPPLDSLPPVREALRTPN